MRHEEINNANVEVCELMKEVLSDQFVLYVKARNFHWNVTGQQFFGLHAEFENIYDELAEDIDKVAERIRALGLKVPGTMKEFWELSTLEEKPDDHPESLDMIKTVVNDFEIIIEKLKSAAHKMQNTLSDEVSAGMFYGLVEKYQKTIWMLKSLLDK